MNMQMLKCFEATTKDGQTVRIFAKDALDAHQKLKELYGPRNVPFLPRMIPS
jgi:hypothetical protein